MTYYEQNLNAFVTELNDSAEDDIQYLMEMLAEAVWSENKPELHVIKKFCYLINLETGMIRLICANMSCETKLKQDTIDLITIAAPKHTILYDTLPEYLKTWRDEFELNSINERNVV